MYTIVRSVYNIHIYIYIHIYIKNYIIFVENTQSFGRYYCRAFLIFITFEEKKERKDFINVPEGIFFGNVCRSRRVSEKNLTNHTQTCSYTGFTLYRVLGVTIFPCFNTQYIKTAIKYFTVH